MDDAKNISEKFGVYLTAASDCQLDFEVVETVFEDIINFWQGASEAEKLEYKYATIQLTRFLIHSVLEVRQNIWDEGDFNNSLLIVDFCEKQLLTILGYYQIAETLYTIELENYISILVEEKLGLVYRMPINKLPHSCLMIIKESTSSESYDIKQWLPFYYIPCLRYGLPRVPCIATRSGNSDRRRTLKNRLDNASSLDYFVKWNEMGNQCVFCKTEFKEKENYVIIDCCNHLVCGKCRKLHSWKEW